MASSRSSSPMSSVWSHLTSLASSQESTPNTQTTYDSSSPPKEKTTSNGTSTNKSKPIRSKFTGVSELLEDAAYFVSLTGNGVVNEKRQRKKRQFFSPEEEAEMRERVHRDVKYKARKEAKKRKEREKGTLTPTPYKKSKTTKIKLENLNGLPTEVKTQKKTKREVIVSNGKSAHTNGKISTNRHAKQPTENSQQKATKIIQKEPAMFTDILNDPQTKRISLQGRKVFAIKDQTQDISTIQAAQFTRQHVERYRPFLANIESPILSLENVLYPNVKEDYLMLAPKDEELDPFFELGKNMSFFAQTYFPPDTALQVVNREKPEFCVLGWYTKAVQEKDWSKILESVAVFNLLVTRLQARKSVLPYLESQKSLSRAFIHGLLNQIYARTVSPLSKKLTKYKAFSNFVYGEILPNLFSRMLDHVGAKYTDVFMDLGSGVGNCTLQAALEFGCHSYGVEVMEGASEACEVQFKEFLKRTKYFGISAGKVEFFLKQSFVDNAAVRAIVPTLDIVLVNNYLFAPSLNESVGVLLNTLKPGARIISLKNLVKPGYSLGPHNMNSIFHKLSVEEIEFGNDSVSWTNSGGKYFVSIVHEKYQQSAFESHTVTRTRNHQQQHIVHIANEEGH